MTTSYRLTPGQIRFYHENGYLIGLPPIYTAEEMKRYNGELPQLLALLQPGETAKDIRALMEETRRVILSGLPESKQVGTA